MADKATNKPKNPVESRIKGLIDAILDHRGVVSCGELERFVEEKLKDGDVSFDRNAFRDSFYCVLAAMKQNRELGYLGMPTNKTQIDRRPETPWYFG